MSPHEASRRTDSTAIAPLRGVSVLVARPREQQGEMAGILEAAGAAVVPFAAIQIGPPPSWDPVDEVLDRIERFRWIVFSSANGVRYLLERMRERDQDPAATLRNTQIAVVGPGTAESLASYGLHADLIPPEFRAESLADAILPLLSEATPVLLAQANRGREIVLKRLAWAGIPVERVIAYTSSDTQRDTSPEVLRVENLLISGRIDWVAVTSSAIARSLARIFPGTLGYAKIAAISPITAQTLQSLGIVPDVIAEEYTISGIITAIANQVS